MTCTKMGLVALLCLSIPACTRSRYQILQTEYVDSTYGNVNGKRAVLLDTQTGETWQQTFESQIKGGGYKWVKMPRSE